jgi:photosystem II stability/assembly factor-like uncharacterized protein
MKPLLIALSLAASIIISGCSAGGDPPEKDHMFTDVFAASAAGHVYHSTDLGLTWSDVSTGLPLSGPIKSLALRGSNVLAATDSAVFETSDNGSHWKNCGAGYFGIVSSIISDGDVIYECNAEGLYRSTDNGNFWQLLQPGAYQSLTKFGQYFFATVLNSVGVERSPQGGGVAWQHIALDSVFRTAPSTLACSGTYLYAGTNGKGVFRSGDNGVTWKSLYTTNTAGVGKLAAWGSHLLMSTTGLDLYTSSDNGDTLTRVSSQPPRSGNGSNLALALDHQYAFAGNTGKWLYRSDNYGTSWTLVSISPSDMTPITAVLTK